MNYKVNYNNIFSDCINGNDFTVRESLLEPNKEKGEINMYFVSRSVVNV